MSTCSFVTTGAFSLLIASAIGAQQAAAPAGTDHVAAIKQSLQHSAAALRQFQWVETTAISLKGEEKSRTQSSCYYGTNGKIQKTPIGAPASDSKRSRGLKGKVVENKKEDVSDSAQEAVALVKQYVPPDPSRIEAAKDSGRLSVTPPDASGRAVLVIKDYLKAGDSLTIEVNAAKDVISSLSVATFTDSAKDAVAMKVSWGSFADGTIYPATIHLDVAAQSLAVVIDNGGYEKIGS